MAPDRREDERRAAPLATPPAYLPASADESDRRGGFRAALGDGEGDDVRISAYTDRSISENSIAVHPSEPDVLLCAHNARVGFERQIQVGWSSDGGSTWREMLVETGNADPATAVDRDGTFYVGYIHDSSKQAVTISSDRGQTWRTRIAARDDSFGSDKNHLVVDTGAASPFAGRLYVAWTAGITHPADFGHIVLTASSDQGASWTPVRNISASADTFEQGVNLQTGPRGELYACWAIFDPLIQPDEVALGFNASFDGGITFRGPTVAVAGMRGTASTGVPPTLIQTNSMPAMAVDRSGGPRNGWIYLFWTNIGEPGVNVGDPDVYVARSRDGGLSWDLPVRVSGDDTTNAQWQAWGTCDQANGDLYAVFLDRREDPADELARAYVARSTDGGESWLDFPVGDEQFLPRGIGGTRYMGDYIGIAAGAGRVHPAWGDWREAPFTAYISPLVFDIVAPVVSCPEPLTVEGTTRGGAAAADPAIAAFLASASAQDETDPVPEIGHDAPAFFQLGTTLVTFTASDDGGNTAVCSAPLTVVDTIPPDLQLEASVTVLTPANHRMVPVDVTAAVADLVDPDAGFVLVAIESSEPEQGMDRGDPPRDILQAEFGAPDTRFLLRAESFTPAGRVYTIEYAASDASGNVRTRTLEVRVEP